jgi:hypothetical protein
VTGWDRYRPEVLDEVFQALGASSRRSPGGGYSWAKVESGIPRIAAFHPMPGIPGIRADHVEVLGRNLGLDTDAVFRMLNERGGRILDA